MLLFYLKPNKNESLTGLFYRTAKENLMDNLGWIKDNFSVFSEYRLNENNINWGHPDTVEDVSKFLKIDLEAANKMTFTFFMDLHDLKVDNNKNKIKCPWFLYQTTKVCPECLKEDPYHRMDWSFTYSTICSKHKVFLQDKCTSCNRDFSIKTVVNDKCICGKSISTSISDTVNDPLVLEYQTEIDKFFLYDNTVNINDWVSNSNVFYNSLEFFATWIPQTIDCEDILTVEDIKYSGNAIARTRLKKTKTLMQAIPLYIHSFKILKEWPTQFYEYIDSVENGDDSNKIRIFIDVLNKFTGTSLEPIYSEFMNYILKKQLYINNPDHFISLKQASIITKLKEDTIKKSDFFQLYECTFKGIGFYFVNKNAIQEWLFRYNETISKEELRKIWGTSPKSTFNILSNNVLKPAINIQIGSVQKWEIPKSAIETFFIKLEEKTSEVNGAKILLNEAFQWIGVQHSYIIIKAMLAGILPFQLDKGKLGNTVISKDILFKIIRRIILESANRNGKIPIKDVTFLLGVKKQDIEYWINTNRLDAKNNIDITYNSFSNFQSKYFTTFELSMISKISSKSILTKYSNGKIAAVSGPRFNDGERILFTKKALMNL
ncbi:TniQ family protein [Schinkia azotoformans]|uniref:TniQ family protein n=1 Tax=Schinkia azotoformans TaxID=1454 RepID=UPI002DBF2C1D|nr:TniQ family protein [Schinkia azotoformans]MEC1718904.1 TniQ family protein [Schinkia azotoformans]MED4412884.1 TniQ family protein [Schinkia azotoformans]